MPIQIYLDRGVSPEEAAVLALVLNPSLRAERDQRSLSAAQLLQAGLLPNPTLTAGLELPRNNDPGDNFTGYNLGLDWEVSSLITHDAKVRAARAQNGARSCRAEAGRPGPARLDICPPRLKSPISAAARGI